MLNSVIFCVYSFRPWSYYLSNMCSAWLQHQKLAQKVSSFQFIKYWYYKYGGCHLKFSSLKPSHWMPTKNTRHGTQSVREQLSPKKVKHQSIVIQNQHLWNSSCKKGPVVLVKEVLSCVQECISITKKYLKGMVKMNNVLQTLCGLIH